MLYVSFIAISGLGVLGFYQVFKRLKNKKFVAVLGYAAFMAMAFAVMPQNPDAVTAPMDLVNGFRAVSLVGVSAFWLSVGLILGALWEKLRPDRVKQAKLQ
jgi:hypothetical protein